MAPPARLERTTFRLGGGPSILVRYGGVFFSFIPWCFPIPPAGPKRTLADGQEPRCARLPSAHRLRAAYPGEVRGRISADKAKILYPKSHCLSRILPRKEPVASNAPGCYTSDNIFKGGQLLELRGTETPHKPRLEHMEHPKHPVLLPSSGGLHH